MNDWLCPECEKAKIVCVCDVNKVNLEESKKHHDQVEKFKQASIIDIKEHKEHVKLINDKELLIALAKDLLKGADLLAREENLVQPFLAIVLRHVDTISEFKLTEK